MAVDSADLARAQALLAVGRYREVVDLLVGKGAPYDCPARAALMLGQAHLALDEPHLALGAADHGLAGMPTSEWGHRIRSRAFSRLGRHADAEASAREAIRLAPSHYLSYLVLGDALLDRGDPQRAKDPAAIARQLGPDEADVPVLIGRIALAQGDNDAARDAFEEALRIDPNNAAARNNLGIVELRRRNLDAARSHFAGAIRLDPRGPGARNIEHVAKYRRVHTIATFALAPLLVLTMVAPENGWGWIGVFVCIRLLLPDHKAMLPARWGLTIAGVTAGTIAVLALGIWGLRNVGDPARAWLVGGALVLSLLGHGAIRLAAHLGARRAGER